MLPRVSLDGAARIAGWAIIVVSVLTSAQGVYLLFSEDRLVPDFTVFWTAARVALDQGPALYDAEALTRLQAPLIKDVTALRPFVHPPVSLPLFAPLGVLPFSAAIAAWTIASIAAFFAAGRAFGFSWRALLLGAACPPAVLTLLAGQTAFLTGAAMMYAIRTLDERPWLAGVVLAIAGCLKPQVFVAVPIALLAARAWSAIGAGSLAFAALVLVSLPFGPERWLEWLAAVREFPSLITSLGIGNYSIATRSLGVELGLTGLAREIFTGLCVIGGVALAWWGFLSPDRSRRLITLVLSALLITPYAMLYEVTALAPFAAAWLLRARLTDLLAGIGFLGLGGGWGPLAFFGAYLFRKQREEDMTDADKAVARAALPA